MRVLFDNNFHLNKVLWCRPANVVDNINLWMDQDMIEMQIFTFNLYDLNANIYIQSMVIIPQKFLHINTWQAYGTSFLYCIKIFSLTISPTKNLSGCSLVISWNEQAIEYKSSSHQEGSYLILWLTKLHINLGVLRQNMPDGKRMCE